MQRLLHSPRANESRRLASGPRRNFSPTGCPMQQATHPVLTRRRENLVSLRCVARLQQSRSHTCTTTNPPLAHRTHTLSQSCSRIPPLSIQPLTPPPPRGSTRPPQDDTNPDGGGYVRYARFPGPFPRGFALPLPPPPPYQILHLERGEDYLTGKRREVDGTGPTGITDGFRRSQERHQTRRGRVRACKQGHRSAATVARRSPPKGASTVNCPDGGIHDNAGRWIYENVSHGPQGCGLRTHAL